MNRILVTGASGLLGRAVLEELKSQTTWTVLGQAFSRSNNSLIKTDLTDEQQVASLIEKTNPDCIVHCAAERRPDISEGNHKATDALNANATQLLADQCSAKGIFFIYLSTDYVFDGSQAPYKVTDKCNPLNYYGKSKLAGENAAKTAKENCLILRVPILYGHIEYIEESAVTVIAKMLLSREPQMVDHWALRFPTSTSDVASVLRQIIRKRELTPDLHGTFHCSTDECMTKYDMVQLFAQIWDLPAAHLSPAPKPPPGAPRPYNCQLSTTKLEAIGIRSRTPFREGIENVLAPFKPKQN